MRSFIKSVEEAAQGLGEYRNMQPKFVAGVTLVDGTTVLLGFIAETDSGAICRHEDGRIDFVPFTSISRVRIDAIKREFENSSFTRATGPEVIAE